MIKGVYFFSHLVQLTGEVEVHAGFFNQFKSLAINPDRRECGLPCRQPTPPACWCGAAHTACLLTASLLAETLILCD